jgi:hypothetical protein
MHLVKIVSLEPKIENELWYGFDKNFLDSGTENEAIWDVNTDFVLWE